MATAKQKRVVDPELSVTLKIKGSKLEEMAQSAKKIGVEVVRVRKASVIHPATGEWKLTEDNSKNENNRYYRHKAWSNPDGREIVLQPAYEDHGEQIADTYSTRDEYGRIGNAPTLEEAQALFREKMTPEEFTDTAEDLAKAVLSDEPIDGRTEGFAEDILASLGIVKPEPKDELEVNPRRTPQYTITLTIEAHKLSAVEKKAKAAFGEDVKVEKVSHHFSRSADLMLAKEKFQEGAEIIADLKGQMEEWRDNMPDSLQITEKYSEVEDTASKLDDLSNEADSLESSCDDIEFPGMY